VPFNPFFPPLICFAYLGQFSREKATVVLL
jgi:hypothetical protein